jgi:hypothetical protein
MPTGKCLKCGKTYYGQAIREPGKDICCGEKLIITEGEMSETEQTNTVAIRIKPENEESLILLNDQISHLRTFAINRVIATDADLSPVTDDLSLIAGLKKSITTKKDEYVQPIKVHLDEIKAVFDAMLAILNEAWTINRQKVQDYQAAIARKQAEIEELNRKKIELAREEARLSGTGEITIDTQPMEVPVVVSKITTGMGTVGTVKNRKYRIVNFAELDDKYKLENVVLLNKLAKAGIPEIKGVEFYFEESLRVTAAK